MKPTPTETPCPPPWDLRRLLQPDVPAEEAARLRNHLRTCLTCRQTWENLLTQTTAGATPPVLLPAEDTTHGQSVPAELSSPITWSSEVIVEGPGNERQPTPRAPYNQQARAFPFLSPARGDGEIGWLGNYRIHGVLGEGGMGYVFDAFDTALHRRVALKVLKPDLAANPSFRERFLLEARAAAQLPDDHIVTIYQVSVEKDVPYLAMKFLHGESLEHRLQSDGRLPTSEIFRIGREIALGLSAAHQQGLIHRDIKPANIWLEGAPREAGAVNHPRLSFENPYRVKILDFGLARPINESRRLTATGLIVGTPQYLAPEQARGMPLDQRCDLFSLGIVLYRMATGILPFDGADTLAQLTALAVSDPRQIEELASDVPVGLRQLIHQLLSRDPAKRPQTARAVAEALRALEKDDASTYTPHLEREQGKGKNAVTTQPARHKRWLTASGFFGLLKPRDAAKQESATVVGTPRTEEVSTVTVSAADAFHSWLPKRPRNWLLGGGLLGLLIASGAWLWSDRGREGETSASAGANNGAIKIGLLFSLRGAMASGGAASHDAVQLAVEELNKQGGLLGRQIVPIDGNGESDYRKFVSLAEKFIVEDRVSAIFGPRASVNRKAVKSVVEKHDNLLFYPMQFEGLEESPNIIYLGAVPNQQMFPALDYMLGKQGKRRLFLVGSDYVYPHSANEILRDYVKIKYHDIQIVDERYIPFGSTEVRPLIQAIQEKKPDLILNTINGDANVAFFRELYDAGIRAETMPVLSFSMGETELMGIGEVGVGHYAAWSYFQSIEGKENRDFVKRYQDRYGSRQVVSDPMEAVYVAVHLWAQAVQAAGSDEPRAVREALNKGRAFEAPEGLIRVEGNTHYTWRPIRVGRVKLDGQFEIVYSSDWALPPEPFPATRPQAEWQRFLGNLYEQWGSRWLREGKR